MMTFNFNAKITGIVICSYVCVFVGLYRWIYLNAELCFTVARNVSRNFYMLSKACGSVVTVFPSFHT